MLILWIFDLLIVAVILIILPGWFSYVAVAVFLLSMLSGFVDSRKAKKP